MELLILVDNAPHPHDGTLSSEHGLSVLIKRDNGRIVLCDTGRSNTYRHNMENLGLNIKDVMHQFYFFPDEIEIAEIVLLIYPEHSPQHIVNHL